MQSCLLRILLLLLKLVVQWLPLFKRLPSFLSFFFGYTFVLASQIFTWLKLDLIARPWFTNTQCGVVTLHITAHIITGLSVFYSYTVLRKDVREINGDSPPKADAGLKPGETTVCLSEVNVPEFLHSSQPAPNVCGLVCVMTENMDQAAARHWRKGSFVFCYSECSGRECLSLPCLFLFEVLTRLFI